MHVASLLFAYASFALACVIGITYVLLFKEIKAKHLGFFYARLPSLDSLDLMNARTVTVGWLFLTVGVLVGTIWATQAKGGPIVDPRVQAMSIADPKILGAAVCWAVYSFALYARGARLGRQARRVPVGAGVRDRAVQLRAHRLLPDPQPQLRRVRTPTCTCSSLA